MLPHFALVTYSECVWYIDRGDHRWFDSWKEVDARTCLKHSRNECYSNKTIENWYTIWTYVWVMCFIWKEKKTRFITFACLQTDKGIEFYSIINNIKIVNNTLPGSCIWLIKCMWKTCKIVFRSLTMSFWRGNINYSKSSLFSSQEYYIRTILASAFLNYMS